MFNVEIANNQDRLTVHAERLETIAQTILSDAGFKSGEVSIAVVDDPTIHELNRTYLQHDYPTDVLSFVLEESTDSLSGEVIVSSDTAISNALEYDLSPEDELLLYVIHGLLHLVGYEDKNDRARAEMREQETGYLKQCGVIRQVVS